MKSAGSISGFLLIELLVALTIFFAILPTIFMVMFSASRLLNQQNQKITNLEAVMMVAANISQDIWLAADVSVEATESKLTLRQSTEGESQQITYDLNLGKVRRKVNNTSAYLTYDEQITGLRFMRAENQLISFEVQVLSKVTYVYVMFPAYITYANQEK